MIYFNKILFISHVFSLLMALNINAGVCGSKPPVEPEKENVEFTPRDLKKLRIALLQDPLPSMFKDYTSEQVESAVRELDELIIKLNKSEKLKVAKINENVRATSKRSQEECQRLEDIARRASLVFSD